MYDQEPRHRQFKFNNLFNKHFLSLVFFSKVFCCVKTDEVEVDCYSILVGSGGGFFEVIKVGTTLSAVDGF